MTEIVDRSGSGHKWHWIEDLTDAERQLARPDLDDSLESWAREKRSLQTPERVDRLHERLATIWAIETGVIERLYTIDRGVTETLIDLGLQALEQFSSNRRIEPAAIKLIEDQRAALEFVFSAVKDERDLSTSFIRELHQLLCRNQTYCDGVDQFGNKVRMLLIKGDWKKWPNNPTRPDGVVHEYCPPDFVQDEMDNLVKMHGEHMSARVRPEVEAAWLHHRFTQIHPFQDGNGRVARALATLVFLKSNFLPLVIRDAEHKNHYIASLETADRAELQPLVNLFANIQSADLEAAITFVRQIRSEGIGQIAAAAASAARRRQQTREEALQIATNQLVQDAAQRLAEVGHELKAAFDHEGVSLSADVATSDERNDYWWNHQIAAAAKRYGYFADLARPRRWAQLRLVLEGSGRSRWNLVVSLHHKEVRSGVMAAAAFLTTNDEGRDEPQPLELPSASEFSYSAGTVDLQPSFARWLDVAIPAMLERWQARL